MKTSNEVKDDIECIRKHKDLEKRMDAEFTTLRNGLGCLWAVVLCMMATVIIWWLRQ